MNIPKPKRDLPDTSNNKDGLDAILETWLDEAMATSMMAISPVDGYRGITSSEEAIDAARTADYDKALAKAKAALTTHINKERLEARVEEWRWISQEMPYDDWSLFEARMKNRIAKLTAALKAARGE